MASKAYHPYLQLFPSFTLQILKRFGGHPNPLLSRGILHFVSPHAVVEKRHEPIKHRSQFSVSTLMSWSPINSAWSDNLLSVPWRAPAHCAQQEAAIFISKLTIVICLWINQVGINLTILSYNYKTELYCQVSLILCEEKHFYSSTSGYRYFIFLDPEYSFDEYFQLGSRRKVGPIKNLSRILPTRFAKKHSPWAIKNGL